MRKWRDVVVGGRQNSLCFLEVSADFCLFFFLLLPLMGQRLLEEAVILPLFIY